MSVGGGQLSAQTSDLVDFYFTHTHRWFLILTRHDILLIMHSETSVEAFKGSDKGIRACFWAIIALTVAQRYLKSKSLPTVMEIRIH